MIKEIDWKLTTEFLFVYFVGVILGYYMTRANQNEWLYYGDKSKRTNSDVILCLLMAIVLNWVALVISFIMYCIAGCFKGKPKKWL
jgi:hypothetical protein